MFIGICDVYSSKMQNEEGYVLIVAMRIKVHIK